jgi:hypothetical protein
MLKWDLGQGYSCDGDTGSFYSVDLLNI